VRSLCSSQGFPAEDNITISGLKIYTMKVRILDNKHSSGVRYARVWCHRAAVSSARTSDDANSISANAGSTRPISVQLQSNSRGWLHRLNPRKRHQMRHLCDFACFIAKQVHW
jgi:hypothetical protein